ncbi:uncharacterized protein [Drosophila tropicalis]|uniref:uncharacterized protein n=1 Tax=Drosophila tropicalis TaxID=46794 RepID=UPI0035AB9BBD
MELPSKCVNLSEAERFRKHLENMCREKLIPISAIEKVQRFCYIGNLENPVYNSNTFYCFDLSVEQHFERLGQICGEVSGTDLVDCLKGVLRDQDDNGPRHDEALLVLAVYLSTSSDEEQRKLVRSHFTTLVVTDKDLLIFTKLAKRLQKLLKRKTPVSRTTRKAIVEWYKKQSLQYLLHMWSVNEGGGFNWSAHRELLHCCHYRDCGFEPDIEAALRLLSTPMKELAKWPIYLNPVQQCKETIMGIVNLRLDQTPNKSKALPIVEKLNLSYEHIPGHLLRTNQELATFVLPKMTYDQLLHSWPVFSSLYQCDRTKYREYVESFLNEQKLQAANISPLRFLLEEKRLGRVKGKPTTKTPIMNKPNFMSILYKKSFGLNKPLGLRINITLNLEQLYLRKSLSGRCRSIKYIDAIMALAFGYFKSDSDVHVQFWHNKNGNLKALPWTKKMSVDEAKVCCENQSVVKVKQTLGNIVMAALSDTENTYDVFLAIVPCATRGNPRNSSEVLSLQLAEYRKKHNVNAKFIILSLRQCQPSMTYSSRWKENILELCSINEQTTRLIGAFTRGKFN